MSTQEKVLTKKELVPLYVESINMMEGLEDKEIEQYLEENPRIIPLFEIDVVEIITPYINNENLGTGELNQQEDPKSLKEFQYQQEAMEREMQVSQRVKTSVLPELNLARGDSEQKMMLISNDMPPNDKTELVNLLQQYKDMFAWSFEDMKGLDPTFCQHQIHLNKDAKPMQQ